MWELGTALKLFLNSKEMLIWQKILHREEEKASRPKFRFINKKSNKW